MDLCISGRFIKAETALQWGLITEMTSSDELMNRAQAILGTVLAMAPLAVAGVMASIDHGYDMSLDDALHLEAVHFSKTCATSDKKEGVDAFLNKRSPQFKGR